MPTTLRTRRRNNLKRLNYLCFSTFIQPQSPAPTSSLLQEIDHNRPSFSTSSTMIKNFNTLYHHHTTEPEPQLADIATAFASNRFFFSSPGRSNSIVESTPSSFSSSSSLLVSTVPAPANDSNKKKTVFNGSVAVPTYSPDPYMDFRRSMQEMVEAQPELMKDVKSNWETLHELLLSYLAINPNNTHKFILDAFSDLIVTLMSFSSSSSS
ncbi:putative transcription factor OFP family [Medicago truncatula]|uniref:Transcription repressor n=1 Tax=Medicago truncatula TaxID=3880 RepID=A0A072U262_MEDTR|nr:transcription repressor OFP16 [Medicago truncatula]KEH23782.1 ovate transcriptional repressor [Medicago truncatula]RHN48089.1 putative transcription factor OFP family [Medicago truncatula]